MKINVITVTYGKRFVFLEKTLNAVISDSRVDKIILVDNGSENGAEIDAYIKNDQKKKIILVRHKENRGSAGGFRAGILEAIKNKSDYVLFLDDDNVIENNWSDYFIHILNYFPGKENVILRANRNDNFNSARPVSKKEIFKINYFKFKKRKENGVFQPVIHLPCGAFRYGGTFMPFKAIEKTDPPFEPFYLYADDTEYFFRINESGYTTYKTYQPMIDDIDHTFSDILSPLASFDKNVSSVKLFFMTRNRYALALMTKSQTKLSLCVNGMFGISMKIAYAFIKLGIHTFTVERSKILIRAFFDGINLTFDNEKNIGKYIR